MMERSLVEKESAALVAKVRVRRGGLIMCERKWKMKTTCFFVGQSGAFHLIWLFKSLESKKTFFFFLLKLIVKFGGSVV